MTTPTKTYRTLPDGSIDYAYYIARAHMIRNREAGAAMLSIFNGLMRLFPRKAGLSNG